MYPLPIRHAYPRANVIAADGGDLAQCRFFCMAKKYPSVEALPTAASATKTTAEEVFILRLEPFPPGFNVVSVDTSRMSVAGSASISKTLNRRSIMELCHPDDRLALGQHLNQCVRDDCNTPSLNESPVYRARLVDRPTRTGGWVRVRLRTTLLRPSTSPVTRSFVSATHTVIDPTELLTYEGGENIVPPPSNARRGSGGGRGGLLMAVSDNNRANHQSQKQPVPGTGNSNNNNTISSKSTPTSPSTSSTDEAKEKNLLLKQLLNVNYSRGESPINSSSAVVSPSEGKGSALPLTSVTAATPVAPPTSTSSNSGILKLLSQHSENKVPRKSPSPTAVPSNEQLQQQHPLAGLKRTASGSLLSPSRATSAPGNAETSPASDSGESSSVCKQNPALISLLSKPTTNSVAVPPPVPTKWHQEPREKLPRTEDGLTKFLPPHPAERAAGMVNPATSATSATATVLQPRPPISGLGVLSFINLTFI